MPYSKHLGQETYPCPDGCGMSLMRDMSMRDIERHDALYHGFCERCRSYEHAICADCGYSTCTCKCCVTYCFVDMDGDEAHYRKIAEERALLAEERAVRLARRCIHRKQSSVRGAQVRRALIRRMYRGRQHGR